jgi:NAD(P)-dependent dehydrogenase (short-subunit alcohol dehydrogenase family)
MIELAGKTAFVTGGASGIGLALAEALAHAGMNVMLADIERDALTAAVESLSALGLKNISSVVCDVADLSSMKQAAGTTYKTFGNVHVVCNNAGVTARGGIADISVETWRWVLDVNLMGVVHGISTFLPRIRAHGEGGHIVNTASMGGLNSGLGFHPYSASKFAVVNMSEGLAMQLKPFDIGVTVVCPGFVKTHIWDASRNRQQRYGGTPVMSPGSPAADLAAFLFDLNATGIDPRDVARQTVAAIRQNELYVFTHTGPEWRAELEQRFDAILAAMDKAPAEGSS